MDIVITNAASLVADADAATLTLAVAAQMETVAAEYDRDVPDVRFLALVDLPGSPAVDVLLVILDDSDQAGALGYHAETPDGHPYARVFARDSIAGLTAVDPASLVGVQPADVVLNAVAQVVSHETIEAFVDPHVNGWADDGTGQTAWAVEACDPVESDTYVVSLNAGMPPVVVSNFVLPAFFDPEAPTDGSVPFDFLGNLSAPFTLDAGGYAILEVEGAVTAVFGHELADWRRAQHARSASDAIGGAKTARLASRTGRRFHKYPAPPTTSTEEESPVGRSSNRTEQEKVVEEITTVVDNTEEPGYSIVRRFDADGVLVDETRTRIG